MTLVKFKSERQHDVKDERRRSEYVISGTCWDATVTVIETPGDWSVRTHK